MAKAWRQAKKWLIKKLGGYTQDERVVINHSTPAISRDVDVQTIKAHFEFYAHPLPPEEYVENRLLAEIAKGIRPYVSVERVERREVYSPTCLFEARIKVVVDDG